MRKVLVEVLVDNLKDTKYYNEVLEVTRRGESITIQQKVLRKGDRYETDIEHAEYLEKIGVAKIINQKENKGVE